MKPYFPSLLDSARAWKKKYRKEWTDRLNFDEGRKAVIYACETFSSVRVCSSHPNEHPVQFLPHHCDDPYCPVCSIRRWERESMDIKHVFDQLPSGRYFHLVFTLPESLRSQILTKDDIKKFRKAVIDTIKKYAGDRVFGGVSSVHLYGDEEPGVLKPHVHVILAGGYLKNGRWRRINDNGNGGLDVERLKEIYLEVINRRYHTSFDVINVRVEFFKKSKLFHRSRYLVHYPFLISDIEFHSDPNKLVVVKREHGEKKYTVLPVTTVKRVIEFDSKRKGHRYSWFGFLSSQGRKKYYDILHVERRRREKPTCPVCGASTYYIGRIGHESGEFEEFEFLNHDFSSILTININEVWKKRPPDEVMA